LIGEPWSPALPSHVERIRRHDPDADPRKEPSLIQPHEALKRPLSELGRYAGWLGKDHVAVAVRAGVHALGAAIDIGTDTSLSLLTLDKDIGRLPSGDLRKMLRKALGEIRGVLGPGRSDV
jgi:hypothetical protein